MNIHQTCIHNCYNSVTITPLYSTVNPLYFIRFKKEVPNGTCDEGPQVTGSGLTPDETNYTKGKNRMAKVGSWRWEGKVKILRSLDKDHRDQIREATNR